MSVVSDASPLIALERIGRLSIIEELYRIITIPPAVRSEIAAKRSTPIPSWVKVASLAHGIPESVVVFGLGAGESEAMALALEIRATVLLMDEIRARGLARSLGLNVIGLGGVLVACKRQGIIPEVRLSLDELSAAGFRMSPSLRRELLRIAGEHEIAE